MGWIGRGRGERARAVWREEGKMIVFSFELPPSAKRGPIVLVLVLEKENLDRMRVADPLDLQCCAYGPHGLNLSARVRDLDFVIAYEEDLGKLIEFREKRDLRGLMRWLERGRKLEAGDLLPPSPLRKT